jgi:hypothetical protein
MPKFQIEWNCSCWSKEDPGNVKMFDLELLSGCDSEFWGNLIAYDRAMRSANQQSFVTIVGHWQSQTKRKINNQLNIYR